MESWLDNHSMSRSVKSVIDYNLRYSAGIAGPGESGVVAVVRCKILSQTRQSIFGRLLADIALPVEGTMLDAPVGRLEWEILIPGHLAAEPEELYGQVKSVRPVVAFQGRYTCVLFDFVTGFRWRLGMVRQDLPQGFSRSYAFHPLANAIGRVGTLDRLKVGVLSCQVDDAGDLESGGAGMFPVAWGSFSMQVDTQAGTVISQASEND